MGSAEYRLATARDSSLGRARLVLLGLWGGALLAFGGLFVPAAFSNLPTQLAAAVLGQGFGALDRAGIVLGSTCTALALLEQRRLAERGVAARLRALLPLAGVLAHATSAIFVTPELSDLRRAAGGTIGQLGGRPGARAVRNAPHRLARPVRNGGRERASRRAMGPVGTRCAGPAAGFSRRWKPLIFPRIS
jgi:hypothetical protein